MLRRLFEAPIAKGFLDPTPGFLILGGPDRRVSGEVEALLFEKETRYLNLIRRTILGISKKVFDQAVT